MMIFLMVAYFRATR